MENLLRELPGEAIGIVKTETDLACQLVLAICLDLLNLIIEESHTLGQSGGKAVLLQADNLLDVILLGHQLTEVAGLTVDIHHSLNGTFQELVLDAQHAPMTDSTAQDTAQHIAAALIRRQDAIHDHDSHGTSMVGNDLQGNILGLILAILHAGNLGSILDNGEQQVRLEVGLLVLHHGSQTLQTAARIDVLMGQGLVLPILSAVILGEHQVPDFQITVAVAAHSAVGGAAAALLAQIDVNLGVRAAGTGADFPEVVIHLHDVVLGEARLGLPDFNSLIIIGIDRHPKLLLGQLHNFCQELPCPGNSLTLEVITKGEVAQHFKVGLVACRTAHILNVASTHTALAGGNPGARRLHLAGKERLQGSHTCTNKEQGRIILRNQGKTRQAQMALFLCEELQVSFTQFVTTHVLQKNLPP